MYVELLYQGGLRVNCKSALFDVLGSVVWMKEWINEWLNEMKWMKWMNE